MFVHKITTGIIGYVFIPIALVVRFGMGANVFVRLAIISMIGCVLNA